jgi:CRP/FNR family transcriptional regulator
LINTNAAFGSKILEKANEDIIKAYNRLYSITHKQIHGRFAELLNYLRERIYQANPFELTLTRKDMAELIHTSPESISRLVKEFKDDGIIESEGRNIEILDDDRLKQISMFG